MKLAVLAAAAVLLVDAAATAAPPAKTTTAMIPAGSHRTLFGSRDVSMPAFRIDRTPVTNGAFLSFVRAHREWTRGRVADVLAEPAYLAHWAGADELGPDVDPEQPVVNVSWFAARAFCVSRGMRLPREVEWERVAAASSTQADGSSDPKFRADLLARYTQPAPARLPRVGEGAPNFFGVRDLHGVVWEWVLDFGDAAAAFAASPDSMRFCGATAGSARDATDFPAFERAAFRSSLSARFVIKNLGFRCAADGEGP